MRSAASSGQPAASMASVIEQICRSQISAGVKQAAGQADGGPGERRAQRHARGFPGDIGDRLFPGRVPDQDQYLGPGIHQLGPQPHIDAGGGRRHHRLVQPAQMLGERDPGDIRAGQTGAGHGRQVRAADQFSDAAFQVGPTRCGPARPLCQHRTEQP